MTRPAPDPGAAYADEAALVQQWLGGVHVPLRTLDGRALKVVFPGVPGGGSGPDVVGAMVDLDGDLLRGDIEMHLRTRGWAEHGHAADPAYRNVVLHVVAAHNAEMPYVLHGETRRIATLMLAPPAPLSGVPGGFTPPCAFAAAQGLDVAPALERLAGRRLRARAAALMPALARDGPAQALYSALLTTLGGPVNRDGFALLAQRLPLAALLEGPGADPGSRLIEVAEGIPLRRAGLRPAAQPHYRLAAAGRLCGELWPGTNAPSWPNTLRIACDVALGGGRSARKRLLDAVTVPGIGRATAVECWTNAILPVAVGAGELSDSQALRLLAALPSPGTYGSLTRLEGWLGGRGALPTAAALQGALLLHKDYCTRGRCGRCPLS